MHKTVFVLILFVAAALRFWNLGIVPPGPNWDEAALGYNAYSIAKTGRDEYGIRYPLSLRSFDDYKPPLYMYLTVPSISLFGLNLWAVRLPAVVMGIIAVIGVFYLAKELLLVSGLLQKMKYIPYAAMFLFAISPWHLQFSRMAFEAGIGVSITIWAAVFFLQGLQHSWKLSVSAFLFPLSLYAYHSQRIFAPLLCAVLGIVFYKQLLKKWKAVLTAGIVGIITVAPLIPVFTDANTLTRLRGTSSLSDQTRLLERSAMKLQRDKEQQNIIGLFFDNRRFVFVQTIFQGYISHFSLRWLFVTGDNARHHAPGMGLLYQIELPLFLLGMFVLAKRGKQMAAIIFGWMLVAPIAASPTTELPHGIRTLVFLPTFQIITSFGIWQLFQLTEKFRKSFRMFLLVVFVGIWLINVSYYLSMYHVQQNREYSAFWQYGYKEAVEYVKQNKNKYEKIIVSTKLEQPHMFFLFHLVYDPSLYLASGGTASGGFAEVRNAFDIFQFRPIQWDKEIRDGRYLYIGTPGEIQHANLKMIYYLNGQEAMRIAE